MRQAEDKDTLEECFDVIFGMLSQVPVEYRNKDKAKVRTSGRDGKRLKSRNDSQEEFRV